MRDVTEVLMEARYLISSPERWTQGANARNARGRRTHWGSPEAVCWCANGAIAKVAATAAEPRIGFDFLVERARVRLDRAVDHPYGAFTFNDSHTHEEVLGMFDRAIAGKGA